MRKLISIMTAIAASGLSTPALAATLWLDSQHAPFYSGDQALGASLSFSVSGVNVRVSGWSISNNTIYQARLGVWSEGIGVKSSNDNSHTIDNVGALDFILLQFDKTVELDMAQFKTGWTDSFGNVINDTDATIGYDLSNLPFGSLPVSNLGSVSQLNVFDLYSSNAAGNSGNSYRDINPGGNVGNLWLIGASFNNPGEGRYNNKYYKDGFKVENLTFNLPPPPPPPGVPEPSTWAMMLVGFLGLGGAMRSSRRRQAKDLANDAARLPAA